MKVLNSPSVQRDITFGLLKLFTFPRVYLLNNVCQIKKNISMCTQNQE